MPVDSYHLETIVVGVASSQPVHFQVIAWQSKVTEWHIKLLIHTNNLAAVEKLEYFSDAPPIPELP